MSKKRVALKVFLWQGRGSKTTDHIKKAFIKVKTVEGNKLLRDQKLRKENKKLTSADELASFDKSASKNSQRIHLRVFAKAPRSQ